LTAKPEFHLRYVPELDGLRGLAILGVLPVHFMGDVFAKYVDTGSLGVKLFFVLSGYLITSVLLGYRDCIHQGSTTGSRALLVFFGRRMLRLSPAYYACLAMELVINPGHRRYVLWYFAYLQNFLFAARHDVFATHLAHFWTLAIEEQFYALVAPILLLWVPRRLTLAFVIAFIGTGVLFRTIGLSLGFDPFSLNVMVPAQADVLGMGALLAVLRWQSTADGPARSLSRIGFVVGIPLTVACQIIGRSGGAWSSVVFALENLGVGLLFVAVVERASGDSSARGFRLLEWAPLVFIGRISYGIYVYHYSTIPAIVGHVLFRLGLAIPSSRILVFLLLSSASIAGAAASFYLYERWFNRLKDSFPLLTPR
jgi:peptidoglycan/LPS O-acetylase OafA/YrhL